MSIPSYLQSYKIVGFHLTFPNILNAIILPILLSVLSSHPSSHTHLLLSPFTSPVNGVDRFGWKLMILLLLPLQHPCQDVLSQLAPLISLGMLQPCTL